MRSFKAVFKFEYLGYVTRKAYIGLTLGLIVVLAVAVSWPRISASFFGGGQSGGGDVGDGAETVALWSEAGDSGELAEFLNGYFLGMGLRFETAGSSQELTERVSSGELGNAVLLHSPLSYTRIVRNVGMMDVFDSIFSEALLQRYRALALEEYGVPADARADILGAAVMSEVQIVESGKDQLSSFVFTYALIFALYFAILFYGQFVSTSVATEKSTRTMEILITSTSPDSLIFGKVAGAGLAGLTQLLIIIGAGLAFVRLNAQYYENNFIINAILGMPLSVFVYALLFFVLGFFVYAFVFAAFASLVSRIEDVSTVTMPVLFLFIIAFFIVMFSMAFGSVDSALMRVASFVPLSSPMAMFARVAMGDVRTIEIVVSIAILAASVIGIGFLATAVYRLGVLLYGVPPKPGEIIRMLRAQKPEKPQKEPK